MLLHVTALADKPVLYNYSRSTKGWKYIRWTCNSPEGLNAGNDRHREDEFKTRKQKGWHLGLQSVAHRRMGWCFQKGLSHQNLSCRIDGGTNHCCTFMNWRKDQMVSNELNQGEVILTNIQQYDSLVSSVVKIKLFQLSSFGRQGDFIQNVLVSLWCSGDFLKLLLRKSRLPGEPVWLCYLCVLPKWWLTAFTSLNLHFNPFISVYEYEYLFKNASCV